MGVGVTGESRFALVVLERHVYYAYNANDMGTVSARLPEELEAELQAYIEDEHLDRSTAVRKLLAEGLDDWRRERAIEQLRDGEVTFSRAAELAGTTVWDFAQLVRDRDVTWVPDDDVDAEIKAP